MERYNAKLTEKKWQDKWEEKDYVSIDTKRKILRSGNVSYPQERFIWATYGDYTMGDVIARYS